MNIICVKKCKNIHNQEYIEGLLYKYNDSDYVDGLKAKYYTIYTNKDMVFGYGTYSFISENFLSVYEYNKQLNEIDKEFDRYLNCLYGR